MTKTKHSTVILTLSALALAVPMALQAAAAKDYTSELAGFHQQQKGLECASCHKNGMEVSDSEREMNASCTSCHGDLAKVAATYKKAADEPNPHASHLGTIQCTACHSAHQKSEAYCLGCHDFPQMKIPFGGGAKPAPLPLPTPDKLVPTRTETVDMIVVGSGAAGFVAAMEAHDAGVRNIVILEKMAVPGGNSQLAAGGMNAAGSIFQKAQGIEDKPEWMAADTLKGGKNVGNPKLVDVLADGSAESIKWLADRGAKLENVARGAGASAARMHGPKGGMAVGPYLSAFFRDQVAKMEGVDLRLNSRMVKIVTDKSGAVTGVVVEGKHSGVYQLNAKAVVLATGGLGANKALVKRFQPSIPAETKTSNQPGTTGDGMLLGEAVGAATVDMKEIQLNPTLLVGSPVIISETVRGQGAVFVNREGKRFIQELATRDVTSAAVSAQTGGTAFEIFDDNTRAKVGQLKACFQLGLVKEGATLEELGKNAGIDPKALAETIKTYNGYVDAGKDAEFGRPDIKVKLTGPKYYAIEITPAIHYAMGGLKINEKAQVINVKGAPIEGLYAAGETTGGVHGKNRLGGNSISETITFGRIAGDAAAERILQK